MKNELEGTGIGYVLWYDSEKGYGVIKDEKELEIFIHNSNLSSCTSLYKDAIVVYQEKYLRNRLQALQCRTVTTEDLENLILRKKLSQNSYIKYNIQLFVDELSMLKPEWIPDFFDLKIIGNDERFELILQLLGEQIIEEIDGRFQLLPHYTIKAIHHGQIQLNFPWDYYIQHLNEYIDSCKSLFDILFKDSSEDVIIDYFFESMNSIICIDSTIKYSFVESFLLFVKDSYPKILEKCAMRIRECSTEFYRLRFCLYGFLDELNYTFLMQHFGNISPEEQRLGLKKIFQLVHLNLIVFDRDILYKISEPPNGISTEVWQIDYLVAAILNCIRLIENKKSLFEVEKSLYILVETYLEQFEDPGFVFDQNAFFDGCEGRAYVIVDEKRKGNEKEGFVEQFEVVGIKRETSDEIGDHPFCDGRRALGRNREEILDSKYNVPFYWCNNLPCYKVSRKPHTPEEFKFYTLFDFLSILKIDFSDYEYELLLGAFNKFCKFLNRLKCNSCGKLLQPVEQSNYGYWRVSTFRCRHNDCNSKEIVYLNHCSNGKCDNIIDSRITRKCSYKEDKIPAQYSTEGMYICNKCLSCCDKDTYERILSRPILSNNTKERLTWLLDNKIPHKERELRFCYHCGNKLVNFQAEYERILKWLLLNKNINKHIIKSGINGRINWFYLKATQEKFKYLEDIGFEVKRNDNFDDRCLIVEAPVSLKQRWFCVECKINLTPIRSTGKRRSHYTTTELMNNSKPKQNLQEPSEIPDLPF